MLDVSSGLGRLGSVKWQMALCLLLCWVIVFFCLFKGIKTAGKVRDPMCLHVCKTVGTVGQQSERTRHRYMGCQLKKVIIYLFMSRGNNSYCYR